LPGPVRTLAGKTSNRSHAKHGFGAFRGLGQGVDKHLQTSKHTKTLAGQQFHFSNRGGQAFFWALNLFSIFISKTCLE
jgi:hypothetical protein